MKRLAFLFIYLLCVCGMQGQTIELPNKCEVVRPNILKHALLRQSDIDRLMNSGDYGQKMTSEKKFWVVYSDRDNNVAYKTSTSKEEATSIPMNTKLRIALIENKRALVYIEPQSNIKYPKISADAKPIGWIPMDNLLLWQTCIADEVGVYKKALLCLNADHADKNNKDRGYAYSAPDQRSNNPLESTFRFYYVMKETKAKNGKTMVLLAKQSSMYGGSEQNLYAWVPEEMYAAWNQRSCMETTWDKESIRYFAKKSFVPKIYDKQSGGDVASTYKFNVDLKDPYPEDEDDYYRWPGAALRYPILDGTTDDTYQCTALHGEAGGGFVDSSMIKKEETLRKLLNVNVVILLDATKSMDVYSESVYQAIKSGCEYFDVNKYKVQVGVMLYRDKGDKKNECSFFELTDPNNSGLFEFIKSGNGYGYRSENDPTNTESLYFGMKQALQLFKNPEHSNVLIVVGDCGNNENDLRVTQKDLISTIVKKNVNIVGFQVNNPNRPDWTLFNTQLQSIIRGSLKERYDKITSGTIVRGLPNSDMSGFVYTAQGDENSFLCMGEHRHALTGSKMNPDFLKKVMTDVIASYATKVQQQIDIIMTGQTTIMGPNGDVKTVTGGKLMEDWIRKKFGSSNVSGLIGFTGYTAKTMYGRDVWKSNVFFTESELQELLAGLEPLYNVAIAKDYNNRKAYIDAVKQCIQKMAPGVDMDNSDLQALLQRAMGINEKTDILKVDLDKITDHNVYKPQAYMGILQGFQNKYEKFKQIIDGKEDQEYKYKWSYNSETFYWISIDDMP